MAIAAATAPGRKMPSHRSADGKQSQAEPSAASIRLNAEHPFLSCTQSQLCLALSILKSKPVDVTIRGMLNCSLDAK